MQRNVETTIHTLSQWYPAQRVPWSFDIITRTQASSRHHLAHSMPLCQHILMPDNMLDTENEDNGSGEERNSQNRKDDAPTTLTTCHIFANQSALRTNSRSQTSTAQSQRITSVVGLLRMDVVENSCSATRCSERGKSWKGCWFHLAWVSTSQPRSTSDSHTCQEITNQHKHSLRQVTVEEPDGEQMSSVSDHANDDVARIQILLQFYFTSLALTSTSRTLEELVTTKLGRFWKGQSILMLLKLWLEGKCCQTIMRAMQPFERNVVRTDEVSLNKRWSNCGNAIKDLSFVSFTIYLSFHFCL